MPSFFQSHLPASSELRAFPAHGRICFLFSYSVEILPFGTVMSIPTLETFLLLCFSSQFPVLPIAYSSQTSFPSLFSSYCFLILNSCQAKLLAKLFALPFLKPFLKSSLTFHSQSFNYCFFHPVSFTGNFP